MAKFKGVECATKAEVIDVVLKEMENSMGGIPMQIQMLTEVLLLHLAEHNKLSYANCNIDGVTDIDSANKKIIEMRDSVWSYRNVLKGELEQFIKDNDLK